MKRILLLIAILLVCGLSFAQTTTTAVPARSGIFEPSNKDFDDPTIRAAIHAQQAEYVAAKEAGNYDLACQKALFNFQLAWLANNQGLKILRSKPLTVDKIDQALGLLGQAITYCKAGGSHADQRSDCKHKALKSIKWAEKEKARLLKKATKTVVAPASK